MKTDLITIDFDKAPSIVEIERKIREIGGKLIEDIPFRIAVNSQFVSSDFIIKENAQIAAIPPVQGG